MKNYRGHCTLLEGVSVPQAFFFFLIASRDRTPMILSGPIQTVVEWRKGLTQSHNYPYGILVMCSYATSAGRNLDNPSTLKKPILCCQVQGTVG